MLHQILFLLTFDNQHKGQKKTDLRHAGLCSQAFHTCLDLVDIDGFILCHIAVAGFIHNINYLNIYPNPILLVPHQMGANPELQQRLEGSSV